METATSLALSSTLPLSATVCIGVGGWVMRQTRRWKDFIVDVRLSKFGDWYSMIIWAWENVTSDMCSPRGRMSACSMISVFVVCVKKLCILWLSKMRPVRILTTVIAQADLNLCWGHTVEDAFSDVATHKLDMEILQGITKTCLFKYIENFTSKNSKIEKFQIYIYLYIYIYLLKTYSVGTR